MMTGGKFDAKYLDLGNIQIDGETGNITMTGDINMGSASQIDLGSIIIDGEKGTIRFTGKAGSILWGDSAPVKYQFGASAAGPWHDTMEAEDKYRRDSLDGGASWGEPYQFRGTDGSNGRPGSDANVTFANIKAALQKAASTESTFITADELGAPNIYGGNIYGANIYAGDGSGSFASMSEDGLYLYQSGISTPKVQIIMGVKGSTPSISLGSGSGELGKNMFWIMKQSSYTSLLYTDNNFKQSGFNFREDGVIEVVGSLNATAVFG